MQGAARQRLEGFNPCFDGSVARGFSPLFRVRVTIIMFQSLF